MITKKIKCVHCGNEIVMNEHNHEIISCSCKQVIINGSVIVEGAQGVDWVDVSPRLLNG